MFRKNIMVKNYYYTHVPSAAVVGSSPSASPSSPSDCKDEGVIWDFNCYSYRKGWENRLIKRNPCVPHTLNNVHYKYANNRLTDAFSMCTCNIETLGVA